MNRKKKNEDQFNDERMTTSWQAGLGSWGWSNREQLETVFLSSWMVVHLSSGTGHRLAILIVYRKSNTLAWRRNFDCLGIETLVFPGLTVDEF